MNNLFTELKRRHVFKVGAAYAIVAWLLIQAASILLPTFGAPHWVMPVFSALVIAGFPIALVLAWAFEMTPAGVKRTDGAAKGSKSPAVTTDDMPSAISATPSIAVLPFTNLSSDPEQEYFADGITEELLNSLAGIRDLQVTGRTSSFYFKGKNEDIRSIAEKLDVENVLEGSVRKSGEQVRITAQLINARSGYHLWSKTYDRKLDNIFAIQDDIARSVAEAIGVALGVGELGRAPGMTRNIAAYDEYLQGLSLTISLTRDSQLQAIDHFRTAVDLDPNFAMASAYIAMTSYGLSQTVSADEIEQWSQRLSEAAARARAIAADSAPVVMATTVDYMVRHKWHEMEQVLDNATKGPSKVPAGIHTAYARFLIAVGRPSEAISHVQNFIENDPLDLYPYQLSSVAYAAAGDDTSAFAVLDRGTSQPGGRLSPFLTCAGLFVALGTGDGDQIGKWLGLFENAYPVSRPIISAIGALLNDKAAALVALSKLAPDSRSATRMQRFVFAAFASYLGDAAAALRTIGESNLDMSTFLMTGAWEPLMRDVRKLPSFKLLLKKVGLIDYWRATGNWGEFCHPVGDNDFECE